MDEFDLTPEELAVLTSAEPNDHDHWLWPIITTLDEMPDNFPDGEFIGSWMFMLGALVATEHGEWAQGFLTHLRNSNFPQLEDLLSGLTQTATIVVENHPVVFSPETGAE